ncbi:hypothetical protein FSP39_015541 [Pinctada imbricata]|uniref:C-type lectin domain-containing protein n=1 Tax=Pinctada imbricata TaxID=66713 RepID=A0AA89BU43_PINIB|nr:hypothetical protein FSP39_015541 [Pinctada imbricata]
MKILKLHCKRTWIPKYFIFCFPDIVIACIFEDGWVQRGNYCYLFRDQKQNFSNAVAECESFSADILMPKSIDIINDVTSICSEKIWIGLNGADDSEFLGDFRWVDGTALNYTNWKDGEEFDEEKLCAFMNDSQHTEWEVDKCSHKEYPFLCQKLNVEDQCLTNWTRSPNSDVCYHEMGLGTFSLATDNCSSINAEIVMPKTEEENIILAKILENRQISDIYIGLELDSTRRSFRWQDGTALSFTNWDDGNHEYWYGVASYISTCVSMSKSRNFSWYDSINCFDQNTIMCQCKLPIKDIPPNPNFVYCIDMLESTSTESNGESSHTVQSTESPYKVSIPTPDQTNASENSTLLLNILAYNGNTNSSWSTHTSTELPWNEKSFESTSAFGQKTRETTSLLGGQKTTVTRECFESCNCNESPTENELAIKLANLRSNLTIEKANLSSTIRKLTCADDQRASSRIMGYLGGFVVVIVVSFLLFMDLLSL